jgi:dsDNA-specific endonuclease/ATPase MutS2
MSSRKKKRVSRTRRSVYDKTVDFHRQTLEEAIYKIDALINTGEYKSILVIHGYGQGILKNGLRRHFNNNRLVREYYSGDELNAVGGDGVTIIYM